MKVYILRALLILFLMATSFGLAISMSGCVTEHKALGFSSGVNGFEAELVANAASGSFPFPSIRFLNGTFSYASAPAVKENEKTQVVFTMTSRRSFLGSLFGIDDTSFSMSYIGNPGETAEETVKRINAFKAMQTTITEGEKK